MGSLSGPTSGKRRRNLFRRVMTRLPCSINLATLCASVSGCAYVEERFKDVSNDPGFAVSYRAGETYRLRTDGRIVACPWNGGPFDRTTERLELWSPNLAAREAAYPDEVRLVAIVPAGSTVRVDGLEHNYTFAVPPVPGESQVLRAYGTVESSAGRWTRVRIADDQEADWSFVPGTHVMAFPPDAQFLERVRPAGNAAAP